MPQSLPRSNAYGDRPDQSFLRATRRTRERTLLNIVYISDLDGTLLRNAATLSSFSEMTLRDLLAEGLPFTVASARSVVSMQAMLRGLPLRLPIIEFNGAFLSNFATGRREIVNALEPPVADSVYGWILGHGLAPFVSIFDGTEDRVHKTVRVLCRLAYETLGTDRVEICCDGRNERSLAAPRRLGFVHRRRRSATTAAMGAANCAMR